MRSRFVAFSHWWRNPNMRTTKRSTVPRCRRLCSSRRSWRPSGSLSSLSSSPSLRGRSGTSSASTAIYRAPMKTLRISYNNMGCLIARTPSTAHCSWHTLHSLLCQRWAWVTSTRRATPRGSCAPSLCCLEWCVRPSSWRTSVKWSRDSEISTSPTMRPRLWTCSWALSGSSTRISN